MQINTFYIGLNANTLIVLCKDKEFSVIGASYLDFLLKRTLNPINWPFQLAYFLRKINKLKGLEVFLIRLWRSFQKLSSEVFRRYGQYLVTISANNIEILDVDGKKTIEENSKLQNIDIIVVNTWNILSKDIISIPRYGTINIHPSKLPKYRGALPTLWSLKNRDKDSAVSYVLLDKSVDGGKILKQISFKISEMDTWHSLEIKINNIIRATLIDTIKDFVKGKLKPIPQNDTREISYTKKYEEYRRIDWKTETAREIFNKVNLYPFLDPGVYCYFVFNGKNVYLKKASCIENGILNKKPPSKILEIKKFKIIFTAKNGSVATNLFRDVSVFNSLKLIFCKRTLQ